MSDIRIRRVSRYQDTPESSTSVTSSSLKTPVKKKGLHWFLVLLILRFISSIFEYSFPYVYSYLLYSSIFFSASITSQSALDIAYYALFFVYFLFQFLWILLTKKRYSHSIFWLIYTVIRILSAPFLNYYYVNYDLHNLNSNTSLFASASLTTNHLIIPLLLSLIPLVYLFFAIDRGSYTHVFTNKSFPSKNRFSININSIKQFLLHRLGGPVAYILLFIISIAYVAFPCVVLGFPFWLVLLIALAYQLLSHIGELLLFGLWIWAFTSVLHHPLDAVSIAFYSMFVFLVVPSVISFTFDVVFHFRNSTRNTSNIE